MEGLEVSLITPRGEYGSAKEGFLLQHLCGEPASGENIFRQQVSEAHSSGEHLSGELLPEGHISGERLRARDLSCYSLFQLPEKDFSGNTTLQHVLDYYESIFEDTKNLTLPAKQKPRKRHTQPPEITRKSVRLIANPKHFLLNQFDSDNSSSSSTYSPDYLEETLEDREPNKYRQDSSQTDFSTEEEVLVWDRYYRFGKDANTAFTGFGTATTVSILKKLLNRRHNFSPSSVILEIGHGLFPCATELYKQFRTAGRYTGAEISTVASREALKQCLILRKLVKVGSAEFVQVKGMNYFEPNISKQLKAKVLFSKRSDNGSDCTFAANSAHIVLAKSTLDYFTSRLDKSGKFSTWKEDLRISPSIVELFDSLSDALLPPNIYQQPQGYLIFIEPNNEFKLYDHLLTIFKTIHSATFLSQTSARFLRLDKVCVYKKDHALGILLSRSAESFKNFEELRAHFNKTVRQLPELCNQSDAEYLLPLTEPQKWRSKKSKDIERLVSLHQMLGSNYMMMSESLNTQ